MRGPDVLLMDEPLAALDGPRKAELLPYLQGLGAEAGVPILYVTHAMAEVAQLADQLVVLDKGRVARNGPVADVLADPMAAQYFAKRDGGALLHCTVARHAGGLTVLDTAAGEVLLPGTLGAVGSALRLSIPAQDVILSRQPLEGQSALNMLQAAVATLRDLPNGNVAVVLRAGDAQIWAELTPVSVTRLGLAAGQDVYAVFGLLQIGVHRWFVRDQLFRDLRVGPQARVVRQHRLGPSDAQTDAGLKRFDPGECHRKTAVAEHGGCVACLVIDEGIERTHGRL